MQGVCCVSRLTAIQSQSKGAEANGKAGSCQTFNISPGLDSLKAFTFTSKVKRFEGFDNALTRRGMFCEFVNKALLQKRCNADSITTRSTIGTDIQRPILNSQLPTPNRRNHAKHHS
jgi:hypothetical protein